MLRFLQISDIHFRGGATGHEEGALDYGLRQALIEDARSAVAQAGGVSAVLVCGDLANWGSGSEFTQASTWLHSLCSAIGVPPWMVWVVPGNHDLDRAKLGAEQLELRRRLRSAADGEQVAAMFAAVLADGEKREALLDPLYNYIEFASAYDCTAAGAPPTSRRLDGPLLRPDQAAVLLAVKTSWVYDAVRTGNLPCIRVGRHIRFTRGMLEEWLEDRYRA
jgi:excisionase family DNA binding protein